MRKITLIIALLLAMQVAQARILNVPSEYATIQTGIDASVSGDTVLVAEGTYVEIFTIANKNILLTSESGPDSTVVRGYCHIRGNTDSTCVIRGLSFISNGNFSYSLITIEPSSSPKIEGNILRNNFYVPVGGAITVFGSNPIIRNNIIRNNQASYNGGGICFDGSSGQRTMFAEVSFNIIYGNTCATSYGGGYGGGIYLSGDAIIKYNIIYDNIASNHVTVGGYGGGIYKTVSSDALKTIIMNNTIVSNAAYQSGVPGIGAGIYIPDLLSFDTLIIKNNVLAFNSIGGNVIMNPNNPAMVYWDYNLVFGDTVSTFPHGEHDIFVDPLLADTASDDFHLLPGSPCIDAGDPNSPLDPDSTRADIGALFFNQVVDIEDPGEPSGPYAFELHQNYPNPFNGETIISYNLPRQAKVSLRIFDMTGRIVNILVYDDSKAPGAYQYRWDGTDLDGNRVSTGIYLYELSVDGQRQAKTLIILK